MGALSLYRVLTLWYSRLPWTVSVKNFCFMGTTERGRFTFAKTFFWSCQNLFQISLLAFQPENCVSLILYMLTLFVVELLCSEFTFVVTFLLVVFQDKD